MLSYFSLIAIDSHGTLHLAFGWIGMHSDAASIWAVTKLSDFSFRVCFSDVSWIVLSFFLTDTIY